MAASSKDERDDLLNRPGQGRRSTEHRCKSVSPEHRIRAGSLTRNTTKMIEVGYELFQWCVDMAETLQARVPTDSIIAQALLIIEDAKRYVDKRIAHGDIPPELRIPCDREGVDFHVALNIQLDT